MQRGQIAAAMIAGKHDYFLFALVQFPSSVCQESVPVRTADRFPNGQGSIQLLFEYVWRRHNMMQRTSISVCIVVPCNWQKIEHSRFVIRIAEDWAVVISSTLTRSSRMDQDPGLYRNTSTLHFLRH